MLQPRSSCDAERPVGVCRVLARQTAVVLAMLAAFVLFSQGALGAQWRMRLLARVMPPERGFTSLRGDINGDHLTDFVNVNIAARGRTVYMVSVFLNDGAGGYLDVTTTHAPRLKDLYSPPLVLTAAFVDIDNDGDLDVVSANGGFSPKSKSMENTLLLNDGSGRFTDVSKRLGTYREPTNMIVPFDANLDGKQDLFILNSGLPHRLLFGDGKGFFKDVSATHLEKMQGALDREAAAADLDGDGDLDLVLARFLDYPILWFNDGKGHFKRDKRKRWPIAKWASNSVAVGDVDGDGDIDVVLPNQLYFNPNPVYEEDRLLLNDGKGNFTVRKIPFASNPKKHWTRHARLGDLDGDGDLDYIASEGHPDFAIPMLTTHFYLNDGKGNFTDATGKQFLPDLAESRAAGIEDLDDDGDLDFVSHKVTLFLPSRYWINMTRQVYAPGAARIGRSYRLQVWADKGPRLALLFVGLKRTFMPLPPFGTWRIDPASMIGPGVFSFAAQGSWNVDLPIPNDNALVGAALLSQALIIDQKQAAKSRFTNVMADRIGR